MCELGVGASGLYAEGDGGEGETDGGWTVESRRTGRRR